jgi:hypothetical protein
MLTKLKYYKLFRRFDDFVIIPCTNKMGTYPVFVRLYGIRNGVYYLVRQAVSPPNEWEDSLGAEYALNGGYPEFDNL